MYGARNPETPKSLKKVSREEFGTPKSSEKSPKIQKIVKINYVNSSRETFFETFRGLGLRPLSPPRGVLGPFEPKVGNGVENEFPGPSGPGAQKVKNRVGKESKSGNFNSLSTFSTLF